MEVPYRKMLLNTVSLSIFLGLSMLVQSFRAMANMPDSSASAIKIEALCSISNAFTTCHPQISRNRLIINYPSELVVLEPKDIDSIKVYDSRTRQLIRFFKKTGDVDFAVSFRENGEIRTGFVRFKNNRSSSIFFDLMTAFAPHKISK